MLPSLAAAIAMSIAGLILLFVGGEWLVRGAAALALRLGISSLAIGLTVVAFGTSAPELVVSLQAVLSGADDISLGNVVGSNIANIALILGLAALIRPLTAEAKIVRIDLPLLVVVSLVLIAILADGGVSRIEGGVLVVGLVVYTAFTFWESRRESEAVQDELASAGPESDRSLVTDWLFVGAGLGSLVLGGHLLVDSAIVLARQAGLSEAVIGLTLVAVGTSLPELATTVVAARRGQGDIAIGGVVGSNLFNILCILGVTASIHPLTRGAISWVDLGLMTALAIALAGVLYVSKQLAKREGVALVIIYGAFIAWQFNT